jgi:YD repeat-containing protein
MRRFICATLLISLCLQSTGAAAAGPEGTASIGATIAQGRLDLQGALNWFFQAPMIAFIAAPDRYASMHAPPPTPPPHTTPKFTAADLKNTVRERPINWRAGTRGVAPPMLERPILPKDSKKVPALGSGATNASVSSVFTTPLNKILSVPVIRASAVAQPPHIGPPKRATLDVTVGSSNNTGINPWWTYEEGPIPGVGKYMVNVTNGNLIVQSDDVDIPERGIDLAFRRTYNSMSGRDWNADDGAPTPGQYGDGWTNTFDTHLAVNSSGGVSVFDIDGARYDYTPNGTGCLTGPAGMYNTLCWDGGCGYFWTKKSGTVYYYFEPSFGAGCEYWATQAPAYAGRLYMIFARNNNNWIRLNYSWAGGPTSAANLSQITATHEDGHYLTLNFVPASSGATLLSSLVRPDGVSITYAYDASNDLTAVTEPSNGSANSMHAYGWYSGHQMSGAAGPRWTTGSWGGDGGYVAFSYSNNQLTNVWHVGIMNFTPPDGTGTQLQPGLPTTGWTFGDDQYGYSSGVTTLRDWDGHGTNWYFDSVGRVTQTQEWSGAIWLITYATWDSSNSLIATVDPRGAATGNLAAYETDYAYDTNGNTIALALPAVSTNQGTFRPTTLLSYDRTNGANNIVESCDPVKTHSRLADWTANPGTSDSLCPNESGASRYSYEYGDSNEPFGRLLYSYSPCYNGGCAHQGEHRSYFYSSTSQGGDFGLPTSVTQDCFNQYDGSQNCPQQAFSYDAYGNLTSYSAGIENGAWTLAYDGVNRATSITDPDGVTTRTCYQPDGSVSGSQTAAQYAADGGTACGSNSVSYTYDADGDKSTEVHHYNNVVGTTSNWYDGADRLVEVALPHDTTDLYSYHWLTRNVYDLGQTQAQTIGGASVAHEYGNLFKTQEWNGSTWPDLKGSAFDALDRVVAHYQYQPVYGANGVLQHDTLYYDQSAATEGLLGQKADALGQNTLYTYDADGKLIGTSYTGDGGVTPSVTMTMDADGRPTSILSSTMGTQSTTYDADGLVSDVQEAAGGGVTSPANLTYAYYQNGQRSGLSVVSTALTQTNLLQYSYRADGMRKALAFADGGASATWSWTRNPSGRVTAIADSSGQPARALSYDAYGRVTQDAMPSGSTNYTAYDDEGEVTGFSYPGGSVNSAGSSTIRYTVRGEIAAQSYSSNALNPCDGFGSPAYAATQQQGANGFMVADDLVCGNPNFWTQGGNSWDSKTGAATGNSDNEGQNTTQYAFDAAARQTAANQNYEWSTTCGDQTCQNYGTGTLSKTYDAENHLLGESVANWDTVSASLTGCTQAMADHAKFESDTFSVSYAWGPNGHPVIFGGGPTPLTLHWDGNTPLLVTTSSGVAEVKIEGLGFYVPGNPVQFVDRNQSGFVVASHDSNGHANWSPASPAHQTCDGTDYSGATLREPGPDGIGDGVNFFQGVRNYDPSLGTWTTPDAYAGDVSDPMSQKAYMWNRGNSFAYADPSGYVPDPAAASSMQQFYDDLKNAKTGTVVWASLDQSHSTLTLSFGGTAAAEQVTVDVGEDSVTAFAAKNMQAGEYQLGDPSFYGGAYIDPGSHDDPSVGVASIPIRSGSGANDIVATDGSHHSNVMIHGGGSALGSHAFDPQQSLGATEGCIRMHNADAKILARIVQRNGPIGLEVYK